MPKRFSECLPLARHLVGLLAGCALAALLHAATPQPGPTGLAELDEVLVTAEVTWPLEDYVAYPQFDKVVISPGGTHLAITWENAFPGSLSVVDLPSMKPRSSGVLQLSSGVADLRWIDDSRMAIQTDWPALGFRHLREPYGTLLVTDLERRTLREVNPFAQTISALSSDLITGARPGFGLSIQQPLVQ